LTKEEERKKERKKERKEGRKEGRKSALLFYSTLALSST
jgi:hypothetical protein